MSAISEQAIRLELERILSSETFRQKRRLRRFLRFVVSETVKGHGEGLKEFAVGIHVFGKGSSFDPRNDPIVRVQAGRLRASLARYYREEGSSDPVRIDLPKGHYLTVFRPQEAANATASSPEPPAPAGTVIVLPFSDYSPQGELGYFCQGIQQEITHALVSVGEVRVVVQDGSCAGASSVQCTPHDEPHAATMVCGGVRKFGNRLRITCQLIHGSSGVCLSSDSIDRGFSRLFAIQEEIAQCVLRRLRIEFENNRIRTVVNFKAPCAELAEDFSAGVAESARTGGHLSRPLSRRHDPRVVALGQVRG